MNLYSFDVNNKNELHKVHNLVDKYIPLVVEVVELVVVYQIMVVELEEN
jgi:hypothetical protein